MENGTPPVPSSICQSAITRVLWITRLLSSIAVKIKKPVRGTTLERAFEPLKALSKSQVRGSYAAERTI